MFDPSAIHDTVKKIKKQSLELDVLNEKLKTKCIKQESDPFPPIDESEKPVIELEKP